MEKDYLKFQSLFLNKFQEKEDWKYVYLKNRPPVDTPINSGYSPDCLKFVLGSLVMGYGMGGVFSLFMNAGEHSLNDITLSNRTQVKIFFRDISSRIHRQGKSFAIFGALIFSYQCPFESNRGTKDTINGFFGGFLTGAFMAISRRAGIRRIFTGALGTGLFVGVFDFLLSDTFM